MGLFLFLFCCRTFGSLASNNNALDTLLNLYYFQNLLVSPLNFHFFEMVICISLILVSLDIIYQVVSCFSQAVTAVCYQQHVEIHVVFFFQYHLFSYFKEIISNEEVKAFQLHIYAKIKFLQRIKYWRFCTLMHSFKCLFRKKKLLYTQYVVCWK